MIEAVIFDMDGTLVETEELKALSYAQAAFQLRPSERIEREVLAAFEAFVGRPREQVAKGIMDCFGLTEAAAARMAEFGVSTPWEAFVALRLQIYDAMIADPELLTRRVWPHNVALLHEMQRSGRKVALATMSYRPQVSRVLEALDLAGAFEVIATREDVRHGKPAPEIYLFVAHTLGIAPGRCLVIEDSPAGVEAALAAGMRVVAVSTPLTRRALCAAAFPPPVHVVHDPAMLPAVAAHVLAGRDRPPLRPRSVRISRPRDAATEAA